MIPKAYFIWKTLNTLAHFEKIDTLTSRNDIRKKQNLGKPPAQYYKKQLLWMFLMVQGLCTVSRKSKPQEYILRF